MTSRKSSGSSRAESSVEPTRSQNITVSCRRSASAGTTGAVWASGCGAGALSSAIALSMILRWPSRTPIFSRSASLSSGNTSSSMALSRNASAYRSRERPRNHVAISITSPASRQLRAEFCGVLQVSGVEALGERAVEGCEQVARLAPPALLAPQPGEARGGAQFVALCALLAGDREGGAERLLGLRRIGVWQATGELAAQAMNFCAPASPVRNGRCCQCVVQGGKGFLYFSGK